MDLRKVLDTVDHLTFFSKLSAVRIAGHKNNWFNDYLTGRSQVVGFNGVLSDIEPVTVGVPQGSILGPLLFVLHVNDVSDLIRHCSDLNLIGSWLWENRLLVNVTRLSQCCRNLVKAEKCR